MFGFRKDEDLENYNEKYASKYDDDYIAPSEEYRSECSHDHEQTYSDVTDVGECEHSHEQTYSDINEVREYEHHDVQTYSDADSEQKPYDDYVILENFFEKMLYQGEHLIWVGSRGNAKMSANKSFQEKSAGSNLFIICVIVMIAGFFISYLLPVGVILLIAASAASPKKNKDGSFYALTNKRVIVSDGWDNSSVSLQMIKHVEHKLIGNNTGNVYITTDRMYYRSQRAKDNGFIMTFQNIVDPARVESLLNDAIHGFF